jgi:putative ABC transport system permease protein
VPARIRHGHAERRIAITGKPAGADLSRVLDARYEPVRLPESGIALSDMLARILDARVGDVVEVELLERDRRRVNIAVAAVIQGYLGLNAYMDLGSANALLREGELISGAHVLSDPAKRPALFAQLKQTPAASFVALQGRALERFRETLAQNLLFMITIYVSLGSIIAFGVVYNFARISLSEQGRELASLRVLGFTRREVSAILLSELAIVTVLAQPLGWLFGYGLAFVMVRAFENELYRVPLVVGTEVYAWSTLVVIAATLVSAVVVHRRVGRLDLIEVLKTRE